MNDPVLSFFNTMLPIIYAIIFSIAFLVLLLTIGNLIISKLLSSRQHNRCVDMPSTFHNGKFIGNLERFLVFVSIIVNQWSLLAIIVALKTIARYTELDDQEKAEYFLIGSMLSLIWAILLGFVFIYFIKETEYLKFFEFLMPEKYTSVKII